MGIKLNPKIVIASVTGLILVAGSLVFSQIKRPAEPVITAHSPYAENNVRNFINITDSDNDGIPDWQDSLNIPTIYLTDDKPEVATMTKTALLAVNLGTDSYIGTNNNQSISQINSLINQESIDRQYTKEDIVISYNNDLDSLRAYGNRVAAIAFEFAPPAGTENELTIVNRAISRNDATVLSQLEPTIESYQNMLDAMLKTQVPSSLVKEHLSLINVYNGILNDIKAFRYLFSDALPSMTRLRRYQSDTEALYLAISAVYLKLDTAGVKWTQNDMASRFIKIE